ncbi:insulin-like growth factor-binding protein complex acid labile subunit [Copidosoma floridanum]|uniref:insulin-like growth factor-binding protein complex acid labile subunit n=1 Tax=Copidosoma floridanum TaxID=29053 RepID=UPI0006C95680|nr:insulin-like growth factor-binding protein complex acid labile subunit [Copidosoma floridanum]
MHFTWLLVLMITPLVIADSEQCRYERSNDMLKAFCNDSTYNLIPQDLNKTIMVLSVSNKNMNLDNKTFANYLRLEELYLQNNTIMKIHEDAFAPLQHLKILDLRHNRLTSVPYNIFVLPNLRVLDLSHNILYNESFESVEATSPIESLSMAWNMITKMPSFKSLYKVTELNLNSNIISEIPIDNLASMCSLEKLSVSSLYYSKEDEKCECEKLKKSAHEWGIKVLDAKENRIRELRNDSLSKYTNLRYLYLQDNFVQQVADRAFEPTYYLEVLDLSKNGIFKLPSTIFQLQYLRNLYLNHNKLKDEVFNVDGVKSPLQWLHLADNLLTQLPQLKSMVTVTLLNVSYNDIAKITADDVAPLCSLQLLDLTGNPVRFNATSCECHEFKEWCKFRKITLKSNIDCPAGMEKYCVYNSPRDFPNRTLSLHNNCLLSLRDRAEAQKARSAWIWIASCIIAFMFCIFVALCCMHKRDRGKRRQLLKEQQIHAANNANTEQLLNKEPIREQS